MAKHIETLARDLAVTAAHMNVATDRTVSMRLADWIDDLESEIAAAPALDAADAAVKLMIAHQRAETIVCQGLTAAEIREVATEALASATQAAGVIPPNVVCAAADTAAACRLLAHIVRADLAQPRTNDQAAGGAMVLLADAILVLERDAGVPVRKLGAKYYLSL